MKKYYCLITIIAILVFLFTGCGESRETHPLDAVEIPDSGYEQVFSPVESATLYINGTQQEIAPDDPRLIRVLNFLGYSLDTMQSSRLQGMFDEEGIALHYASKVTMLEITFAVDPADRDSGLRYATKILIGGDAYLYFVDSSTSASMMWPYANMRPEDANRSGVGEPWEEGYWLDILAYCGF